jgi:hypothetical protein
MMVKYKVNFNPLSPTEIIGFVIFSIPLGMRILGMPPSPNFDVEHILGAVIMLKGFINSMTIEEVE